LLQCDEIPRFWGVKTEVKAFRVIIVLYPDPFSLLYTKEKRIAIGSNLQPPKLNIECRKISGQHDVHAV